MTEKVTLRQEEGRWIAEFRGLVFDAATRAELLAILGDIVGAL